MEREILRGRWRKGAGHWAIKTDGGYTGFPCLVIRRRDNISTLVKLGREVKEGIYLRTDTQQKRWAPCFKCGKETQWHTGYDYYCDDHDAAAWYKASQIDAQF